MCPELLKRMVPMSGLICMLLPKVCVMWKLDVQGADKERWATSYGWYHVD